MRVKTAGQDALITSLFGGNQQKVVIGKILLTNPKVILLDEPTRGIDVGAKGEIFALLFREAKKGLAVLYVTSEVGEAITASHRLIVMSKGGSSVSSIRVPPPATTSWPPPASTTPTTRPRKTLNRQKKRKERRRSSKRSTQ